MLFELKLPSRQLQDSDFPSSLSLTFQLRNLNSFLYYEASIGSELNRRVSSANGKGVSVESRLRVNVLLYQEKSQSTNSLKRARWSSFPVFVTCLCWFSIHEVKPITEALTPITEASTNKGQANGFLWSEMYLSLSIGVYPAWKYSKLKGFCNFIGVVSYS